MNIDIIFENLNSIDWQTVARTYGNDHSTLIGLIIQWWINILPERNWALEGGPSFGYTRRGKNDGGQCDAILCSDDDALGILEVEGTRLESTIIKLGNFFEARRVEFESLIFAIVLLYAYGPIGRGENRHIPLVATPQIFKTISQVSRKYQTKTLIIITLDKQYERQPNGIRKLSDYYYGNPSEIRCFLYRGGRRIREKVFPLLEGHSG